MDKAEVHKSDLQLYVLGVLIALVILAFDLSMPLGVAAGVPYVGVVLIAWWGRTATSIYALAVLGTVFTVFGYVLSPEGGIPWVVAFNRILAVMVIWVTVVILRIAKVNSQKNVLITQRNYTQMVENAPIGIVSTSPEGGFISVNPAFAEMLGYESPDDVIESITDIGGQLYVNPDLRQEVLSKIQSEDKSPSEYQLYRKDGGIIWISESARSIRDDQGNLLRYETFITDVTDRKENEKKLVETNTFLEQASELSSIGFWICEHKNFTYPYWSESMETIFGFNPNEKAEKATSIPSASNIGMTHPEDADRVQECFNKLVCDGLKMDIEYRIVKGDGEVRWIREIGTAIKGPDGDFDKSYGSTQDITERVLAEQALKDVLQFNEAVFASSPVGISIFDETGQCISTNDAICKIIGGTHEDIMRQNYHHIQSWKVSGLYDTALECLKTGEEAKHEMDTVSSFGKQIAVECHLAPITVNDTQHLLFMMTDLSDQKALQAQMIEQSKMATLGEMATGIAHELNQPLSVIRMAVNNIQRKSRKNLMNPDYLSEKLVKVESQVERASAIIDHMRIFGRNADMTPLKLDPKEMVDSTLKLIGEQLRLAGIDVTVDAPEACHSFLGHRVQVEQVLLNLLGNARDQLQGVEGDKRIKITISQNDETSRIMVEDTGGGMPQDVLPRIFEPFFSTKELGAGTGLGLSISYGIIADMGGSIAASNTDQGACFTITLPVCDNKNTVS